MPIELGDSWFSAKDILVSRLIECKRGKALIRSLAGDST